MPKTTLKYANETDIPAELRPFKTDANTVEIWYGGTETVAAETNPTLETAKNKILDEKKNLQTKYDNLLTSSSATATELNETKVALANKAGVTPEEMAIINAVKTVKPDAKADDVKTILTEFPKLQESIQQTELEKTNNALFEASGLKSRAVFDTVWNNQGLNPNFESVVWKDEVDSKTGTSVKRPYVKVKSAVEGKSELAVSEYATKTPEWNPFMPALTGGQTTNQWLPQPPSNSGGNNFQTQTTNAGLPSNPLLDSILAGAEKAANPPDNNNQAGQQQK